LGKEDVKHIVLSCPETRKCRREFVTKKWLNKKEEAGYKSIKLY
jgi:hypothetical protein